MTAALPSLRDLSIVEQRQETGNGTKASIASRFHPVRHAIVAVRVSIERITASLLRMTQHGRNSHAF